MPRGRRRGKKGGRKRRRKNKEKKTQKRPQHKPVLAKEREERKLDHRFKPKWPQLEDLYLESTAKKEESERIYPLPQ